MTDFERTALSGDSGGSDLRGFDENHRFTRLEIGTGRVESAAAVTRFVLADTPGGSYSNAQIFDYAGLRRSAFPIRPPVRLEVRAWFSHEAAALRGTAGFGFWNQPYMPRSPGARLPRYVWFFFGGAPMNMALAAGVPGAGWKAMTADFSRAAFMALAPLAPIGFLLMRIPALYRSLWPTIGQRAIGAAEAVVGADMREPHHYRIDWLTDSLRFSLDDRVILQTSGAPRGPLGTVIWMDNQYAILTPQGQIGAGLVPVPGSQWMAIEGLRVTRI